MLLCSFRVIGLPQEEEWPTDVTVQRKNFPPPKARPITDFVPEINEQGAQLLMVGLVIKKLRLTCFCTASRAEIKITVKLVK